MAWRKVSLTVVNCIQVVYHYCFLCLMVEIFCCTVQDSLRVENARELGLVMIPGKHIVSIFSKTSGLAS
jgi:hypothetical protein